MSSATRLKLYGSSRNIAAALAAHEKIAGAVRRKSACAVSTLMRSHILDCKENYRSSITATAPQP